MKINHLTLCQKAIRLKQAEKTRRATAVLICEQMTIVVVTVGFFHLKKEP